MCRFAPPTEAMDTEEVVLRNDEAHGQEEPPVVSGHEQQQAEPDGTDAHVDADAGTPKDEGEELDNHGNAAGNGRVDGFSTVAP
jgi:hypothetical protein